MAVLNVVFVSLVVVHSVARTSSLTCSPQETSWVVEDSAGAFDLASSTNCSDGVFDVEWRGYVEFPSTFSITDGSILNITGAGASAVANGGGRVQFLNVVDATVHVNGIRIENCLGALGGGMFASGSDIAFSETSFSGNIASDWGGALYVFGSNVSWSGETSFNGNTAGERGGALCAGESYMSWSGETSFSGNSAEFARWSPTSAEFHGGGALYVYGSSVSWSGETKFSGNTAGEFGGGVLAVESDVSWTGATNFSSNFAGIDGGALLVDEGSIVSWSGETSFSDNTAWGYGGALNVFDSIVIWSGETNFSDNDGHALTVFGSNLSWSGNTNFSGNYHSYDDGGALYVYGSNVSWRGETTFSGNTAEGNGGALHVAEGSSVSWSGETSFTGNNASGDGGGDGGALHVAGDSSLSWDGETSFSCNNAKSSGGAVALVGTATTLSCGAAVFEGNMAELSGGALYTSALRIGPIIVFSNFTANRASQGGAVYSASSGTYEDQYSGRLYPTTYSNCTFTDNWARATGGAIESAAGSDRIEDTTFVGNSAGAGGALRLGGSTTIAGCTFIDNVSGPNEGASISNVGVLTVVGNNTRFAGSSFWCEPRTFRDTINATVADVTRFEEVCNGCGECDGCEVDDEQLVPVCTVQMDHTESEGGDTTIQTLKLDSGYWRATNLSRIVRSCYNAEACAGGLTGTPTFCQPGYEGSCEEILLEFGRDDRSDPYLSHGIDLPLGRSLARLIYHHCPCLAR